MNNQNTVISALKIALTQAFSVSLELVSEEPEYLSLDVSVKNDDAILHCDFEPNFYYYRHNNVDILHVELESKFFISLDLVRDSDRKIYVKCVDNKGERFELLLDKVVDSGVYQVLFKHYQTFYDKYIAIKEVLPA